MSKRALADRIWDRVIELRTAPRPALAARRASRAEVTARDELLLDLRERARYLRGADRRRRAAARAGRRRRRAAAAAAARGASAPQPAPRPRPPVLTAEGVGLADLDGVRGWIGDCQRCKLAGDAQEHRLRPGQPERASSCSSARRRAPTRTSRGSPSSAAPASS